MEDNKRKLYDALSEDYDLGSFEQFSADIADETKRRKLYDAAVEDYDFGDFDSFSSQLGFGKAAPAQAPAAEETVTENFDDQPDLRALNEKARKSAEKEQRKAEKEAEMAAREARRASERAARDAQATRRSMTPQERTRAFNQHSRIREAEREARIAKESPEAFANLKAAQKAEDEAFRARREQEKAERVRAEQDVQRFGTGNGNYSFEDAVSAGKEYEAIAPEVAGFEKRLADFNERADLVNAGKLRLTPEQAREMQSEADALSGIAKRYDAVMNTAPGKEYKDISERMTALAEGPKTADSAWEYAQAFASLERNPIYRASLGENAPSEDEINSNLLQGQIAYLEERMKSAKGSEKKALKKAYSDAKEALYANPYYRKHLETKIAENKAENEAIGVARANYVQQLREGYKEQGVDPNYYWQMEKGDPELQKFDAAAHMHDDAIREYKTPTKYDDSKGLGNVAKGLGNWATDTGTWSFGIEDFVEDIAVVRPVLEKVQSIVGNLNEDEVITEGNIKALEEQLTPGELAVLDAYFEKVGAKAAKGADTSIGYQIGQGIGDMVNLGIEMVATGGAGGAVRGAFEKGSKKALVKLLGKRAYRKAAQSGVGRVALWATAKIPADMVETAVRLPFMPSTYKALGEKSVELSSDYKVRPLTEYAPEAMWDQYVEQLTEVSNGFAFPLIGKVVKTPGMQKMIKGVLGENGSKALRAFMERGDIKLLDDAMIGSFGGEWEEELLGAVIHSITDDPAALRDFFSAEQQLVLLGTLAPIPITRGAVGGIALGVPSAKADLAWNRVERDMRSRGFDDARIARLKDVLDNAPVPEAAREAMNAYNDAVEGLMYTEDANPSLVGTIELASDGMQGRFYEDLAHYFWATQQKRAVGLVGEIQKDEALAAKREELNNLYGTFSYEREMPDGSKREVVETATMTGADGNPMNVLLLSDSMASNEVAYVSQDGTQHGFVDPLADPGFQFGNVIETDRYLARLIMQDGQVEQAEQVIGEAAAVNESLRQQVESLPEITFQGKTGSLVRNGEDGAVFVPDDGTDNIPVTWEQLASENGIGVPEVTTDAEKTDAGVAEVAAHLQAKAAIADSFNEALDSGFNEVVVDTDDGPAHVLGIIEDSIDPDAGTAQFTVQLADGSRSVTMSIPIEPILSQLRGETSAEPAPEAEPEAEPEAAPVEEPAPEEPEETAPKIPLDKNGNPIYDAPGVSVEDALEDMYSTEGLDEADVDEYIINKANETDKARNVKQGKMSLKEWGQAKKEANRVADFWSELREFAEENKRAREADEKKDAERQKLIEKYGVDTSKLDLTPQTLQEAVAEYILTPGIISLSDAIKHVSGRTKSGRVPAELFRHLGNGGILSKKGGASISDVAADVVREFYGDLEHDDEQDEARDYIIDFLWRNTKSEIRDFIFNNRLEEARRMAEHEEEPEPEILEPAPEPVKAEEPAPEPEPETTVEETAGESAAEKTEEVEDLPEEEEEPEPEPAPVPVKPEPNPPAPAAPEVPEPRTAPEGDILLSDLTDVIDPWVVERLDDAGFTTAREVLAADMGAVALDADLDFDTITELYVILRRELGISSEAPASVEEQIEEAREQVDTNPTEAQKEAGNYRKGHVTIDGMDITIENPKGSVRSGVDSKGNKWSVTMNNDYGYIRMTEGVDGDHIDVFLSDTPSEGKVFVVDQVNPDTGEFDEHKVMYGFNSEEEAREAYLANYSEGWKGLGNITEVTKEEFAKWIDSSKRKTKPFAEYAAVKNAENTSESRGKSVTSQVKEEAPQPAAPSELTEEEIRNSGYPDEDIIDAAVDYINGDKSFANTAAYKLIKDYVGSQRGATEQTGGDADGAQLDGRGVRTSGMGADAGGGEAGAVGGGQSETPAERIPGPADGRVPSGEGSPASPAGEGLPADVPDSGGNGRGGRGGARESGRSHDDGRGQAEPAPQPQQPARREIEAGSTDIDALGGELEDLLKQFGATDMSVERQAAPGLETMSYSEVPESETKEEGLLSRKQPKKPTVPLSMDGLTPKQMDLAGKIIFSSAKLGYAFAKTEGLTTFNDFRRWFKGKFGDAVMKGLNYDESSLDAFIREVWNTKMKIDGERRTLEQHASELHNAELRAMAEKTIPQRKQEQAAANEKGVKPIPGNRRNIAEALPMLVPGQWDDVVAIERQLFDPSHDDYDHAYGKGMLITNGTGTGKTFTGLGTIKRFLDMGKKRILLVCPAGMVTEWTEKAQLMGIKMTRLADTKDKGEGVVATSYQNFRENRALYEGEFDLVVYDESQNIIENQQGEDTLAYEAHKRITNKDVENATERLLGTTEPGRRRNELLAEQRSLETESKKASTTEQRQAEIVIRTEEIENEIEQLNAQLNLLKPKFREQAEAAVKRTKVLFLSATPFNTVNNLKYAEGYIYQYPKVYRSDKTEVTDEEARRSAFITEWFRGDEPMEEREIAFGDHLLDELETASFRELENGYDHSRDFPDVSGNVMASRFNAAWQAILGDPRFRSLKDAAEDILKDRTWSTQLFETMKVSAIRDRLKEHLDAGRKIVIFHDRMHETKAGGKKDMPPVGPPFAAVLDRAMNQKGTPPTMAVMLFRSAFADVLNWEQTLDYRPVHEQIIDFYATDADRAKYAKKHEEWEKKMEQWRKDCEEFERQHPTWSQEKIYEKMPKAPKEPKLEAESVVTYNGERTEKEKEAAKAAFNDDNSKVKIICVTTKSGGAGLSLHDTTGKFPRVMIQTALPVSPIGFIQAEGRIFRWGNRSNAVFEYPRLGINLEAWVFAVNFNAKAETVENLAHGFRGRGLKDSIMTGFYENAGNVPIDGQGIGGVEMDRRGNTLKGMAKAKHDFGVAQRKGIRDFDHSIPEPVGFKMAEWAMVQSGDNALIPFAGRGSIARYMPKGVSVTAMEPDSSLQADLMITSGSEDFKIRDGLFTELSQINKADVVLMNGHTDGGLNEVETMRKGFMHLSEGGRLIAVVPSNAEADYTITDLASSGGVLRASIKVSNEALGRGKGTSRIVVIDKITKTDLRKKAGTPINEDLSNASQEDLFGLIDSIKAPERIIDKQAIAIKKIKSVLTELRKNKLVGEINVLDEENQKARIQFNMADRFPKGLTRSRYRFDSFHNSGWYYTGKWFTVRYSEFAEPTPNSELIKAYQWLKEVVDITDSNEFRRRADIESGAKEESIELMRELYRQYMRFIRAGYGLTETQIQRVAQGLRPDVSAADIDTLTSYDELRAKFEITNHDDEERLELYGKVAKVGEKIGLKIGAKAMDRDFLGGYNNVENSLTINKIRWNGLSDEKRAQTLLHEFIHSVTVYAIAGYDTNAPGMSDELFNAAKLASDVYDQIQKGTAEDVRPFVGQYAIENAKELLAEMANPEVKEKLMKRRMWVTRSSRGIRVSGAAMEGAELTDAWTLLSEALDGMLEHFDKDLFDRFKGRVSDFFWSVSRDGIYSRPADASRRAPFEGDATLVRDRVLEDEVDEDGVLYRKLDDPEKVAELESEPKVKVYRSMQMVDGKLYPPMSAKVDGKWREPIELGVWEEAEEHPEMADENGEFVLDKGDGSGPMKVAYAPYIHTRRSPLNEQFSSAYNRPNLVIVESEIPESELASNYTAERSMKSTGEHDWPSGKVSNELAKQGKNTRKVILSRWAKPLRVLPASEVADIIAELIGDSDIAFPYNVVTPSLRAELQRRGVRFDGWQGNRPKNVDELIDSMQERLYRRADDLRNPIDRASAIAKAMEIAGKLGVDFVEDSSLKAKGAFNAKTGKIRINIDAHKDTADLEATLLHEAVAHYGLRKLFGDEWKSLRKRFYEQASDGIKAQVDAIAKRDGLSKEVAMEEYIAHLAEDGRFDQQEESFWQKVVTAIKRMLHKIGFHAGRLNDADFRAMLYASYRNLQSGGALESAARISTYSALRSVADNSRNNANFVNNGTENDRTGTSQSPDGVRGDGGGLSASEAGRMEAEADRRDIRMLEAEVAHERTEYRGDSEGAFQRRVDQDKESKRLIEAARRNGLFIEPGTYDHLPRFAKQSKESVVRLDEQNGLVIKIKDPFAAESMTGNSPFDELYVHIAHNIFFPESRYKFLGITTNLRGDEVRFVLQQDYIASIDRVSDVDAQDFVRNHGFRKLDGYRSDNDDIIVMDYYGSNILQDSEGYLHLIDPLISFKRDPRGVIDDFINDGNPSGENDELLNRGADLPEDMRKDVEDLETDQETEVLYRRSSSSSTAQTAAEMYNSRVRTIGSAIGEVLVDEYVPVDKLMEALEAESGVKLRDSERVSEMMRETGGRAMYAIRDYNHRFLEPMWDAVGEFRKLTGDSMEDTEVYIGLKSGLERNVVLAARDAKRDYQAQYDAEIDKINKEEKDKKKALDKQLKAGTISDVTYQGELTLLQQEMKQKRDDAANKLNGHFADVDAGTDPRFLEYRKKDYSAITTWAETEDLEEAERLAGEYVAARENLAGTDATEELWKRINAATKETLRFQYEHQMLSKQQYSDISKMMKFYVPMRGFAEDTAEDLFNYYVTAQSNDFQATLLNAKGRTTMYEGPLGNIGAMHSSAISQGIKNEAKLSLLDAVRRRKDNTIATVTRAWFVKNGQKDANGKDIYEVAYPQIPEGATFSERQAIIEQFENDMADAKSRGDAFNAHREVDLHGGVVAFEREAHKNEHIVTVREGGKEYGIIINGNPAAAQAINGVRRTNGAGEKFLGIMRNWTRFLSSMFTTFSVPFWVSNFQRDHGQGLTNAFIRNTPGYVGAYIKNRMRAAKLFPLILGKETMDKALAKGDAVAVLYKQYLENGGPMGQNRIEDNEYFERQMKRYLDNSTRQGVIKGATAVLDVIGGIGEAIETITRFATFMTSMEFGRPIHESISDAKEISTNFARKGSGRSFSRDELDRMTHADGRKLTNLEKHFVNAVSIGVEICRATIPFFNAAVQGLENKVTNYREHTGKTLLADSIYLMLGLGMNLLLANAGGDDDKEKYSHTSDYLRRNNILNPLGNGVYAKWALPQEYRVMYAMGDILGSAIRQERPIEDLGADAFGALMQLSPIGAVTDEVAFSPENKKKEYETLITNVSPGVVAPVLESIFNMDFKGARIYNEGFNENLRAYPGWTKALSTTGKEYVAMAKFLNELTGGNDVERGWVNINPAIVEHLVESYFSGPYQIVVRAPEAAIKAVKGEATVRDIPLLNRIVLNTNDNQRDAFYSNMYYYFKEANTEAERIHSEYKGRPKEGKVAEFYKSKDYQYMLVFNKYDKAERELRKASKLMDEKGDKEAKKGYDDRLQDIQYRIARECLDIYFDRRAVK